MPDSAVPGAVAIYEYVLREWWEGWDTPAAEATTEEIIAALSAAGFVIVERSNGPDAAAPHSL